VLAGGTVTVRRGIVSDDDVAWTRGVLNYRDTPLDEVQSDLQRWYGYTVRVMDPVLARRTLTASFRADSSSQALRVIALAIGADAVVRGDTVFLRTLDAAPDSASIRSP
jgi:transmembrane sensor